MYKKLLLVGVLALTAMLLAGSGKLTGTVRLPSMVNGVRLAVIGDFGENTGPEYRVSEMVKGWNVDAVITVGDNVYTDGTQKEFNRNVYPYYRWFIDRGLFFPALGNHDWGYPWNEGFKADKIPLIISLPYLPGNGRYYTVTFGDNLVQIFIIDSDAREPDGRKADSIQGRWLKMELSASTAKYKLVFFHEPPFSSCLFGDTQVLQWPFQEWGADAVFNGHCHFYERVMKGTFPYFINGLGGSREMTRFEKITDGSTVRFIDNFGGQMVEATAQRIKISFITIDRKIIDIYVIVK